MRDTVFYEWVAEETAIYSDGSTDILTSHFCDTLPVLLQIMAEPVRAEDDATVEYRLALTRGIGNDSDGVICRSYAYVGSGCLPLVFDDCGSKVPQRFHKELSTEGARYAR